jgi:hypothetical protein
MPWRFDRATLQGELAYARERLQDRSGWKAYERLARAHLWLDQPEEARRWFARALADYRDAGVLERFGHAGRFAESYGVLLRGAGELDAARVAFARSGTVVAEIWTRRDWLVGYIRSLRWLPSHTGAGQTPYDRLEETFAGSGLTHLEMLAHAGLLSPEPVSPAEPAAPPAGRWALSRTTPEGVAVEPYFEVTDSGYVEICLDPSRERPLWIDSFHQDDGWVARLRLGPADPNAHVELPTFGEAMDAARDMLFEEPWARETFDALLGRALGLPGGGVPEAG